MTRTIGDEKVAYVNEADTTYSMEIRDGTALADGLFTVQTRRYYETLQKASDAARRMEEEGRVERIRYHPFVRSQVEE